MYFYYLETLQHIGVRILIILHALKSRWSSCSKLTMKNEKQPCLDWHIDKLSQSVDQDHNNIAFSPMASSPNLQNESACIKSNGEICK